MDEQKIIHFKEAAQKLKNNNVGIIPTDTVYGLVGSALHREVVERIYDIKHRTPTKPYIILISDIDDLKQFYVYPTKLQKEFLEKHWPGPVSVILSCSKLAESFPDSADRKLSQASYDYLHRGQQSLAFRLPNSKDLRDLIRETGPLVAPSANREGQLPVKDITEAQHEFAQEVDFYVDGGVLGGSPSALVSLLDDLPKVLRKGEYKEVMQ